MKKITPPNRKLPIVYPAGNSQLRTAKFFEEVSDAIEDITSGDAIADLAGGATLTDVINKVNEILQELRDTEIIAT